jgi:catechol 2,3-dioxygenase-like lactoylglutathione lyase family enzyme
MPCDLAESAKFHLSLNVGDLNRAVAFYRALFGVEPARHFHDYAKFELDDPPVVFSLTPHPPGPAGGVLGHAGLKVADNQQIEQVRQRLERAGYAAACQQGAVCGYRRQDKLHVADPDGTQWEVYVNLEDVAPELVQRSLDGAGARPEPLPQPAAAGPVVWEHFVTNPLPDHIPHADAAVDEVRLVGTFNANVTDEQQLLLVREARRVLKPGGKVLVHGLMADRPFPVTMPTLPGLAAMVSRVPVHSVPLEALARAGFVGLQITRYSERPWFQHDGVELREVKISGWQPSADGPPRRVLYKGPFAEAVDELGTVYRRGQRVEVTRATWELLRRGAAAENFLFLDLPAANAETCG